MANNSLEQLSLHTIGGGWGAELADATNNMRVSVIRGTDIPRLRVGDFSSVPVRYESAAKVRSRLLKPGDIVVEVSGGSAASGQHTGRALLITQQMVESLGGNVIPASFCRLLRLDSRCVNPRFIVYQIDALHLSGEISKFENQSTGIANFQFTRFIQETYPCIEDLQTQSAIAHILGTLDDKIELLRRQNETLEAMARALFKAWFVDFEPVRAKMNLPSPPGRGAGGEGAPNPTKPKLPSDLLDFARELRTHMTDAETLLWRLLRNRRLAGVKFRRQHPFPPYVLDFYCHEHRLAVEIDGGQHNEEAGRRHDARRDAFLAEHGLRVLRFWNHDVLQQTEAVLEAIFQAVVEHRLPSPPAPLPGGEGGKLPSPPTPLPEGEGSFGTLGADGVWHWPQHILDLFPDRLVESELGEIPEGWECVAASRLIEFNPPESLQKGTEAPYIEMAALPTCGSWPETPVLRPFGSGMRFRNGDTLLARITPCLENGKTAFVQCLPNNTVGWGSTEYIVMRPKPPVPPEFGYLLARDEAFREQAIRSMTGTSGRQRVQADSVAAFKIAAPTLDAVWNAFSRVISPVFQTIKANAEATTTLAALRDTLLPKLISGELRVKDAEAFLKERGL